MIGRESEALIVRHHGAIDLQPHLQALFAGRSIGSLDFLNLAEHCRRATETPIESWKALRRVERLWNLLRYAQYAMRTTGSGGFAECGVFRGFSAMALGHVIRSFGDTAKTPVREFWLADSFEGLSEPMENDIAEAAGAAHALRVPAPDKGKFATPFESVAERLRAFPFVHLAKGWIPAVFEQLPGGHWAFVHVDVDLYQPTLDTLEYFYPRLAPGAIMINDDFGSLLYPGAGKAWAEFFAQRDRGYAILDCGQAVYIHA